MPSESKKTKRARKGNGTYQGDDPSTPDVNEAYEPEEKPVKKSPKRVSISATDLEGSDLGQAAEDAFMAELGDSAEKYDAADIKSGKDAVRSGIAMFAGNLCGEGVEASGIARGLDAGIRKAVTFAVNRLVVSSLSRLDRAW